MKIITIVTMMLALSGCQPTDEEIRADIATKARQDFNFAGLNYTVKGGVVDFIGSCPSQTAFNKIKQKIENIHVINAVNYNVKIAPVVLDTLTSVKLVVDSILTKYPQVTAHITKGSFTLKGTIPASQRASLIGDLKTNKAVTISDSLKVN